MKTKFSLFGLTLVLVMSLSRCAPSPFFHYLSMEQIQKTYQTAGLSSDACKTDSNSQTCLNSWNRCTNNPNQDGCFSGYSADPVTGQIIETLYGFQYHHNYFCDHFGVVTGSCANYSKIPLTSSATQ